MRPISPSLVTVPSSDLAFRHVVDRVAASIAWHAAMAAPSGGTLGRSYLDFVLHEARSDARAIVEAIAAEGA